MRSKIKKLGIFFGDNDFSHIVERVLQVFLDGDKQCVYTKSQIAQLFNAMAGPIMWARRGHSEGEYSEQTFPQYPYLTIDESNIYLDDEVDQLIIRAQGDCNGEFVYIDFDPPRDCPAMYVF